MPASVFHQSCVLAELMDVMRQYRPYLFDGFFYTSNAAAFVIASDIRAGILANPKKEWLRALSEAIADLSAITSIGAHAAKHLSDLNLTTVELLNDIESYDNLTESVTP